ncbi:DgyrCDS5138 [Dimorphilus gyrociliatus]|uniref:DgyrCDS5138 n=1 Tax=Dimorphilus gyrociliatus TaxID=2664684 RepID=A0A7I8VIX7_9ANNE|nr:DgyrCDS5138 [Dimorphilus gyrociliatus]
MSDGKKKDKPRGGKDNPDRLPIDGENRPLFFFMFILALTLAVCFYDPKWTNTLFGSKRIDKTWWKRSIVYQIYPRSFQDSDGDGIGDLKGIESRLEHFKWLKIGALWLSPVYKSPMVDFGYDISDFKAIDPIFGSMDDFENLIRAAHKKEIKIIMDFVPNHSSDQHEWFQLSRKGDIKYKDYYIWRKGKQMANGTRIPPNNWVSVFGGPMWTWDESRQAFYLHQFTKEQPDLNFRNPEVQKEMIDILKFWLGKGVDGFRIDAISHLFEDKAFKNEPLSGLPNTTPDQAEHYNHVYTMDQPETIEVIRSWRKYFTEYERKSNKYIFMVTESFSNPSMYYEGETDFPFNFNLLQMNKTCGVKCIRVLINSWLQELPKGRWPNWVLGNHDRMRLGNRMGEDFIGAFNMLLLTLPGTPFTYYGEEIGMVGPKISFEDTVDPYGVNFGPKRYEEFSRDPSRTPMQWSDSRNAGFTMAKKPWLPVHSNYKTLNVENQKNSDHDDNTLRLYRRLSWLRQEKSFQMGNFDWAIITDNILSYIRWFNGSPAYIVAFNFGTKAETVDFTKYSGNFPPPGHFVPDDGFVLFSTHPKEIPGSTISRLDKIKMSPSQGVVIRIWPKK